MSEVKIEPIDPVPSGKARQKRHILLRLFGISVWGWLKLLALCILVGFLVLASEFDPADPGVNVLAAMGDFLTSSIAALRWAIQNFWKPALAGASIVLPVWFLWRLFSLPFRK